MEDLTMRKHTEWLKTSFAKLVDEGLKIDSDRGMKEVEEVLFQIRKVLGGPEPE